MRLFFYLKKNYKDQWIDLTSIGPMGPSMSNPFLWFRYLYDESKNDDSTIIHYKKRLRILFMCIVGLLLFVITVIIGMGFYL